MELVSVLYCINIQKAIKCAKMTDSLQIGSMLMLMLGGLSLFLYGMDLMTSSLKTVASHKIKRLLSRMTTNRFKGVLAGAFTTAVIQSSSVTTVLVVGFVAAGLMRLQQSIGIIMGAGVGTTITAQVIAFNITHYALLLVSAGFLLNFFSRDEKLKRTGIMILGFGLVFFGMSLMGDATRPLRNYEPFVQMLQQMHNPLYGVLLSAVFTAIVQSSSATTGVIIVLASQGLISLEQGIALVFGANIGTSVTAMLASVGRSRDARRTALVHVLFNVLGVLLWFGFITPFAELIRQLSPVAPGHIEVDRLAAEMPRQIANAHTIFNVGNTLLFIGFTPLFASLVTWLVPVLPQEHPAKISARYLDLNLLQTPALALDRIRMELGRLAGEVMPMITKGPRAAMEGSGQDLREIEKMDDNVDILHDAIIEYCAKLSQQQLTQQQADQLSGYMDIARYFENMGDTLATDLVYRGRERLRRNVHISPETRRIFDVLAKLVIETAAQATQAVTRPDLEKARSILMVKTDISRLVDRAERHLVRRLIAEEPHRLSTYRMESELLGNLKRVHYLSRRIAKAMLNMGLDSGKDK